MTNLEKSFKEKKPISTGYRKPIRTVPNSFVANTITAMPSKVEFYQFWSMTMETFPAIYLNLQTA